MQELEKKFQKSMIKIILMHVFSSFIIIFLIESHIPWRRGSLGKHFELRSSIDFLLRCSTPITSTPEQSCIQNWTQNVNRVHLVAAELGVDGSSVAEIKLLQYPDFLSEQSKKEEAQKILLDVASGYDREWTRKNTGYLTAVTSGGWIVAVLSIAFLVYLGIFYKVIRSDLILPILEVMGTFSDWKGGNRLRRCQKKGEGRDLQLLMDWVNELLDERLFPKKDKKH